MEPSFDSLYYGTQNNRSQKSLALRKPQKLLSSVKGFVHRSSRSVNIPASKSHNSLSVEQTNWPPRSRSLNSASQSSYWTQRGRTPGMDDYLTLAELEGVWITQDPYVGCPEAPQGSKDYTYVEPVEAPTITKHQISVESPKPPLPQLRIPPSNSPAPTQVEHTDDEFTENGPLLEARSYTSSPLDVHHSQSESSGEASPISSPSVTTVRNAVVSGIVHPALRPSPYLGPNSPEPDCRVQSRFAVNVPSSNWTYGKV